MKLIDKLGVFMGIVAVVSMIGLLYVSTTEAEMPVTEEQTNNCDVLSQYAEGIQQWRRGNQTDKLDDYVNYLATTELVDELLKHAMAIKVFEIPRAVPPMAVRMNFNDYCVSSYEAINKDKTEL